MEIPLLALNSESTESASAEGDPKETKFALQSNRNDRLSPLVDTDSRVNRIFRFLCLFFLESLPYYVSLSHINSRAIPYSVGYYVPLFLNWQPWHSTDQQGGYTGS